MKNLHLQHSAAKQLCVAFTAALLLLGTPPAKSQTATPPKLTTSAENEAIALKATEYLLKVKSDWHIPGMALSIVKDGQIVFAKGFGVKDISKEGEGSQQVSENTLFQIGSVSKSFTALVMASLVDEGLVKWDDTVKKILPDLKLYDKWVEENLQVKDIMTHRMGLKGQMGTYIPNMGYSRDDVYRMIALMKPEYSFRGSYEYNNITFIIAEKIIEKLTGKSWEENVTERVFKPLGMSHSSLNGDAFRAASDVAVPHEFGYRLKKGVAGVFRDSTILKSKKFAEQTDSAAILPIYGEDQALHWLTVIGPAGSVNSTASDLAKYALFHLNNGVVYENGLKKQIVTRKSMDYLHRGVTITSQDSTRTTLYGHCWFVEQNNRYRLLFHTGTTWGFTTLVAFVPELNLGMAMVVNSEAPASPRYAIMRRVIDLYLLNSKGADIQTADLRDYNAEYLADWALSGRESALRQYKRSIMPKEEPKVKDSLPAIQERELAGVYDKGELFGKAIITFEDGQLYITAGPLGWKHKLQKRSPLSYTFSSDGHTFPLKFILKERRGKKIAKVKAIDIDFGYGEDFGEWKRIK